jgi:hypothetical protein
MKRRRIGVTVLASGTTVMAIYSQYAAITMLLTVAALAPEGSLRGTLAMFIGLVFLGLVFSGYVMGFGLWTRRAWSWHGAIAFYMVFFGANIVLSVLSNNYASAVLPAVVVAAAVSYLHQPAVRAEIVRATASRSRVAGVAQGSDSVGLEVARPVH